MGCKMKTVRIPLLRVSLLSCALSLAFAIAVIWVLMPDIFTPDPPPAPADCAATPPAARSPSPTWLADYFGPRPAPPGPALPPTLDGINGLWAPRGMQLEYLGYEVRRTGEDQVDAGNGLT